MSLTHASLMQDQTLAFGWISFPPSLLAWNARVHARQVFDGSGRQGYRYVWDEDCLERFLRANRVCLEHVHRPPDPLPVEDEFERAETSRELWRLLRELASVRLRPFYVLVMRWGLKSRRATYAEIGAAMNVSRERVRQLEARAFRWLTRRVASHEWSHLAPD